MVNDKNDLTFKLDEACKRLSSLIRNPYAIERREKKIKEDREYVRKSWERKYFKQFVH